MQRGGNQGRRLAQDHHAARVVLLQDGAQRRGGGQRRQHLAQGSGGGDVHCGDADLGAALAELGDRGGGAGNRETAAADQDELPRALVDQRPSLAGGAVPDGQRVAGREQVGSDRCPQRAQPDEPDRLARVRRGHGRSPL